MYIFKKNINKKIVNYINNQNLINYFKYYKIKYLKVNLKQFKMKNFKSKIKIKVYLKEIIP